MSDEEHKTGGDLAVEAVKPKLKKPPLYSVVLLNDDFTPMEFVVEVLQTFFTLSVFTREIAETKVAQVNQYSRENKHPLLCEMEEA